MNRSKLWSIFRQIKDAWADFQTCSDLSSLLPRHTSSLKLVAFTGQHLVIWLIWLVNVIIWAKIKHLFFIFGFSWTFYVLHESKREGLHVPAPRLQDLNIRCWQWFCKFVSLSVSSFLNILMYKVWYYRVSSWFPQCRWHIDINWDVGTLRCVWLWSHGPGLQWLLSFFSG